MRALALIAALLGALAGAAVARAAWTVHADATGTLRAAAEFPPVVDAVPDALGVAQVGSVLHGTSGAYLPNATAAQYAWQRCDAGGGVCAPIAGATSADYTATVADVGSTLRVAVTPRNGATDGAVARSEPTPLTQALSLGALLGGPSATSGPQISGTAAVGQTLTGSPGTWSGLVTNAAYQWRRCDGVGAGCADIAGATGSTYTLAATDQGHRLRLLVTVSVLGLAPAAALTGSTARVT